MYTIALAFNPNPFLLQGFILYGFHPIKRWKYRHIPGPPNLWLIGHLSTILTKGLETAYYDWSKEYGPVYKVFWGGWVHIVLTDPLISKKVTAKCRYVYEENSSRGAALVLRVLVIDIDTPPNLQK